MQTISWFSALCVHGLNHVQLAKPLRLRRPNCVYMMAAELDTLPAPWPWLTAIAAAKGANQV